MTEKLYNLIFEGKIEPGHDRDAVRSALEGLFQFDVTIQSQLFSGEPIALGESMNRATADTFKVALAGVGAATRIVAVGDPVTGAETGERRKADRRTQVMRRAKVRSGAIVPDRRQGGDRRD